MHSLAFVHWSTFCLLALHSVARLPFLLFLFFVLSPQVMMDRVWLGETNFDFDHKALGMAPNATAIQINGNDHYILNSIVFSSRIGVEVNGAADYISGVHVRVALRCVDAPRGGATAVGRGWGERLAVQMLRRAERTLSQLLMHLLAPLAGLVPRQSRRCTCSAPAFGSC